jgi:hypothetical protein
MKIYRTVGVQCPICGQQQLRIIDSKLKNQTRYRVECLPVPEKDGAGVVTCPWGTWGEGAEETDALKTALNNLVIQLDANMKVRTGDRAHIVDSLLKQLQPVAAASPPVQEP